MGEILSEMPLSEVDLLLDQSKVTYVWLGRLLGLKTGLGAGVTDSCHLVCRLVASVF